MVEGLESLMGLMKYKFLAYNIEEIVECGRIERKIRDEFEVTVKADNYERALEKAKELVRREEYKLIGVEEI